MPADNLKSLANKAGVSVDKAEKMWDEAKKLAEDKGLKQDSENYWAYVVGIVKNMLGIESISSLHDVLSEAVISKSSASFMKSRMRKVTDELSKLDDGGTETSWKSVALNLRLFFNEYLSSLSSNTGLKALLLGESMVSSTYNTKKTGEFEMLLSTYMEKTGA